MSKFDRRQMLKVMAATAAGGAAAAVTRVGDALPALAESPGPPFRPATAGATAGPRLATTAGLTYKYLDGLSNFSFRNSSTTSTQGGVGGSIYPINTTDLLWGNLNLPQGAVLTEITFSVIVNDTNPAAWWLWRSTPSTSGDLGLAGGSISTQSATAQNITLLISPTTIDNSQYVYAIFYGFGTANSPSTHQFNGVRLGWMLNPGMTLFPNPRRLVDGFAMPFTSGQTYGPFDATQKVYPTVAASGIPVGAKAAFCAVQSYTSGVLTIFPDLTTNPLIANFTATVDGPLSMTYMMIPLSPAGKFKIASYITGKVVVDAWGYVV